MIKVHPRPSLKQFVDHAGRAPVPCSCGVLDLHAKLFLPAASLSSYSAGNLTTAPEAAPAQPSKVQFGRHRADPGPRAAHSASPPSIFTSCPSSHASRKSDGLPIPDGLNTDCAAKLCWPPASSNAPRDAVARKHFPRGIRRRARCALT